MPKKVKPKYTGILAEPMKLQSGGLLPDAAAVKHNNLEEYFKRVEALYEHYGVKLGQPGADVHVAIGLAHDHIVGFQIVGRSRGRPIKWDETRYTELFADVKDLMKRRKISARGACPHLVRRTRYQGQKANSLYKRFMEIPEKAPLLMRLVDGFGNDDIIEAIIIEHYVERPENPAK